MKHLIDVVFFILGYITSRYVSVYVERWREKRKDAKRNAILSRYDW